MDYNKSISFAIEILKLKPDVIWKTKNLNIKFSNINNIPHNILGKINQLREDYQFLYNHYKNEYPHTIDALLLVYDHLGVFNNVSLSVTIEKKNAWRARYDATHELFGSFFNTHPQNTFCSKFAQLEKPRAICDAFTFVPQPYKTYIANPPYDTFFIDWTIYNIIYNWTESNFIIIIPDWRKQTRIKYKLKSDYDEMNSIIEIIKYCKKNNFKYNEFPPHKYYFFDGFIKKNVTLNTAILEIFIIRKYSSVD
jgi:hypothetical protein